MKNMSAAEMIERAREVVLREAEAVAALADQFDESLAGIVAALLACPTQGGHVLVTGVGTSRAMAERFAHLLSCAGIPALYMDATDGLHGGAGCVTGRDVLFIFSRGGRSAEVNQLAEIARARGATIIAQTAVLDTPLTAKCHHVFHVTSPAEAELGGMIATGSSLVNGAAGDALCTILMQIGGYTLAEFGFTHPGGAVGQHFAGK